MDQMQGINELIQWISYLPYIAFIVLAAILMGIAIIGRN